MNLDGKVALITGAASGIGYGIAKRYLEADGRVVIADLNAEGAINAARELADQKAAIGIGMDVTKEDEVNAGVEKTVDAFGSRFECRHSNCPPHRGVSIRRLEKDAGNSP
jgi:3-hydroxybutyrate dehydrogenase